MSAETEGRDRLAVVIGGASGIGEATCILLRQRGWRVVVADINLPAAKALATRIGAAAEPIDILDTPTIDVRAGEIERGNGPIYGMVMCAALFQPRGPVEQVKLADWERIIQSNLTGTYAADIAFARRMAAHGGGAIVNMSSMAGLRSTMQHGYSTSKAGVNMVTEGMCAEWGRSGVRVNAVSPGHVAVPRMVAQVAAGNRYAFPPAEISALGRMVEPREVGETISFLLSDRASAITGANLVVDAGTMVAMNWSIYGGPPGPRPVKD